MAKSKSKKTKTKPGAGAVQLDSKPPTAAPAIDLPQPPPPTPQAAVTVDVPVAEPVGYTRQRLDVELIRYRYAVRGLGRMTAGLMQAGAQLLNGDRVNGEHKAVVWMLEQFND